jgi:hypothetical protein
MKEEELRERARAKLASDALPKNLPSPERLDTDQPIPHMKIGTGDGICALCEAVIGPADTRCEYSYPGGKVIRFHEDCETIWDEERRGL